MVNDWVEQIAQQTDPYLSFLTAGAISFLNRTKQLPPYTNINGWTAHTRGLSYFINFTVDDVLLSAHMLAQQERMLDELIPLALDSFNIPGITLPAYDEIQTKDWLLAQSSLILNSNHPFSQHLPMRHISASWPELGLLPGEKTCVRLLFIITLLCRQNQARLAIRTTLMLIEEDKIIKRIRHSIPPIVVK